METKIEYVKIQPIVLDINQDDWKTQLNLPLYDRKHYSKDRQSFRFGQLFGRILGTPLDEDEYYEMVYLLVNNEANEVQLLSENINKFISTEHFQSIQKVLTINQEENGLSVNRFVAFLEGERLIPKHVHPVIDRHVRETLIEVIEHFKVNHSKGLLEPDFRRIIVDMIKWIWNHLEGWLKNVKWEEEVPRVVWYGNASKSESYFIYFLLLIGCDILVIHPEGKDILSTIDPERKLGFTFTYSERNKLKPFPKEKPVRKSTVAYKASREIEKVLHHEDSALYKPWQFRSFVPSSITLKTTYDELFLIVREKAFIRPNFLVKDNEVKIPSLFAKVSGVSKNRKEYWDRLREVTEGELTMQIRKFPFSESIQTNYHFHYQNTLGTDGMLNPEKMINSNWWKYKHLPFGLQNGIAATIARYCADPKLIPLTNEKKYDVQLYLFTQASNIQDDILKLLQKFDYSQEVPRMVLYNTELNGTLSRSDAAIILFLNNFGIDILLFNPPGHNDVELYIEEGSYDSHWLEDVVFDQEFKEPSSISGVIKKIFQLTRKE